ncbi:MAG: SpoIVB peptidase [Bacillota bacterium]
MQPRNRQLIGVCLAIAVVLFCLTPQYRNFVLFPSEVRLAEGQLQQLNYRLPLLAEVKTSQPDLLRLNGQNLSTGAMQVNLSSPLAMEPLGLGKVTLDFKLFGFIPFRQMVVDIVPRVKVMVGGHSIGVALRSDGMIVIGHTVVKGADGHQHYPAREAGVNIGDVILAVNGQVVDGIDQAGDMIEHACIGGKPVTLRLRRQQEILEITVQPKLDAEARIYRLGIFIRDSAAGVGTLTFYEPNTMTYGALGHVVTDMDTNQPIDVGEGQVVRATVTSIEKGRKSSPGEKRGQDVGEAVGNIERNNPYGIFGTLREPLPNQLEPEPIPIALVGQVKEGPAEILTVVDGDKLERFQIEIQKLFRQSAPDTKGMVVKITDPRLLEQTGGIVQGMSGSPILQNGRLVGAVTHVFVNDPTRGYGIFAEWMIRESGILQKQQAKATMLQQRFDPLLSSYIESRKSIVNCQDL